MIQTWPRTVKYFLHSYKDQNADLADQYFDNDTAKEKFLFTCYEVMMTLEVHEDGSAFLTHVDNVALTEKVPMN